MYFLDTNICVYFLKGIHGEVRDMIKKTSPSQIKIPAIVKAELLLGAEKSNKRSENTGRVMDFLEPFEIISFDDAAAIIYSFIRASLEKQGMPIGPNDYIVASIVLAQNGILITNNEKGFSRIKDLRFENWITA